MVVQSTKPTNRSSDRGGPVPRAMDHSGPFGTHGHQDHKTGGAHLEIEPTGPMMALQHPEHITVRGTIPNSLAFPPLGPLWPVRDTWSPRPL